ncbi:MAG TPA: DPP IV N-terminal domain-containing protein [Nitrolancea sp.]|nr:DPP IV N-terminal domain-containing protein [Nitrolancea sp.]
MLRRSGWGWLGGALLLLSLLAACGQPDAGLTRAGAAPSGRILFAQKGDISLWQGGKLQQVTHLGDASAPSWAPDGQRFVFVRTGDGWSDLFVGQLGGDQYQQLTHDRPNGQIGTQAFVDNASWALDPDWSPSGDTIAYVSDLGTQLNFLWLIQGLGNQPRQVAASTSNQQLVEGPSFSPDGSKIVYTQRVQPDSSIDRTTELWMVDLESGKATRLVQGGNGSYDPAWSPDGRWIAFVQRTGQQNDLWLVSAKGGTAVKLTSGPQVVAPAWAPDSSSIAFFTPDGEGFDADYISFSTDANGNPQVTQPQTLFKTDGVDAPSGMSWTK